MRNQLYILALILITSVSLAAPVERMVIEVYAQDMQTRLASGTATITRDNGISRHRVNYHNLQGEKIYTLESHYQTHSFKTLYSKEWIKGPKGVYVVEVKLTNNQYVTHITEPTGELKTKTMDYVEDAYMGVTISRKLESSLESLLKGEKVVFDILAPGMGRRFSFGFHLTGEQKIAGHGCYLVEMKAENWLIATMAPEIRYYIDKQSGRIIGSSSPWGFDENGEDYAITLSLPLASS